MTYNCIDFSKEGPLAVIVMNRPGVCNAISAELLGELVDALERCGEDDSVRAIILTGAGDRAFCAGGDVKAMKAGLAAGDAGQFLRGIVPGLHEAVMTIRWLSKPIVAAVNGVAAGGGASIALSCDLRVAAEKARFTQSFVNIGLSCEGGGSYFLPRLVGLSKATELLFLGETIDARQAEALGLVHKVAPDSEIMSAARELALQLAAKPAAAIAQMKALLNESFERDLRSQLEAEGQDILACVDTADFEEGVTAFVEKRTAKFGGR
ncbi:MAG: 2-(1,2-epoxy-1,2-dihydrophenyl)acetyl-CoA isomerase [Chloroflexota bacterium]|nr:MAG: 2-(1,2-epoxy-1,2-dihydrophenyl)acetyl-CoA isomerase [Chloroflexota bacterium]